MTSRDAVVFVSPHLDDAVLSCAGAIRQHVLRGNRVVVATVFSEGANASRRRDEDHAAVASLGAEAVHLGLLDAPERLGIARSHRALVEDAVVEASDVASVRAALARVLPASPIMSTLHNAHIYAPLGVGDHVDHRVVHAASRALRGAVFYEDRPYAFLAGAVRARLTALGVRAEGAGTTDLTAAPDRATVEAQLERLPFIGAYLADDDRGARARAWLTGRLTSPAGASSTRSLEAEVNAYDEAIARAASRAIGLYTSQVESLFGGPELVGPALFAAARAIGADTVTPHVERIFRLRP